MATGWNVFLFSENTYNFAVSSATSEIPLNACTVTQTANWLAVDVAALDRQREPIKETEFRNGIPVHCRTQIETFKLEICPFNFPEDESKRNDIYELFNKQYIYLCIDSDVPIADYPDRIHEEDNALAVGLKSLPTEHNHEDGQKSIIVELQKFFPIKFE